MILPSTPGFLLENITIAKLHENEMVGISANQDDLLDKRVFQALFRQKKDGNMKSFMWVASPGLRLNTYLPMWEMFNQMM